ncbi:T9SS type A sorting domain-containing protein [uncultured Polaribacter sp.]|uniref:T9SS type A sorting domain-containing protein n=1 Tax=uncultured Polaribacter sp. TaxID=174711 RepID=UPI0026283218|nr:T9SS type A sorting domain-containing protein [uncultured Polaribacter sp.]
MIKKTIFFLTLMLLSITGYAQVDDPNTKTQWMEGSWGVRLYVRGGSQLDQYVNSGYDYRAGAQEMVDAYTTMGHALTNMTQNARTNRFTLRNNPNVAEVTGDPNYVIHEDFVPSLENEQVIIDVIKIFKDAGKKVLLYLNCKEFTEVDTSTEAAAAWVAYYTDYFGGDEYAARTNLMQGYMKRFKEMGVDGYWLDACAINERNMLLINMMRELDPNMVLTPNTLKSEFFNPNGSKMVVLLDGCDDDDPDPYGVIKYETQVIEADYTGGHVFPLGQGSRGDSWSHDEFTIPNIQETNYHNYTDVNNGNVTPNGTTKAVLKHMFMPMRQQWSVASAQLRQNNETAYRMAKKITMAGGAITFSCTTTDGTIKDDEHAILTYVNQKFEENDITFSPYVRPECAFLVGEEVKTPQSISFPAMLPVTLGSADIDPGATATSGLDVIYLSADPKVAVIVDNKIKLVGKGMTRITARQNGDDNYRHASFVTRFLSVVDAGDPTTDPIPQSISFAELSEKDVNDPDFSPFVDATSGLEVTLTSSNPAVATVVDGTIQIQGAGVTNITASQPGNANFLAATDVVRVLTVTEESGTGTGTNNLALNGTATQSSPTLSGGVASRAIDNDTNGNFGSGSVTAAEGPGAWWEVDLGAEYNINDINVFNRTNGCCTDRLGDFTVFVLDANRTTTYSERITTEPSPSVAVNPDGAVGKIIRIESNLTLTLNLAEVQVFGDAILGIEDNTKTDRLLVYPNPTSDNINIDLKGFKAEAAEIQIIDYLGKTIHSGTIKNGRNTVYLSNLSSGLYIIKVLDDYETYTRKIIKK